MIERSVGWIGRDGELEISWSRRGDSKGFEPEMCAGKYAIAKLFSRIMGR